MISHVEAIFHVLASHLVFKAMSIRILCSFFSFVVAVVMVRVLYSFWNVAPYTLYMTCKYFLPRRLPFTLLAISLMPDVLNLI